MTRSKGREIWQENEQDNLFLEQHKDKVHLLLTQLRWLPYPTPVSACIS